MEKYRKLKVIGKGSFGYAVLVQSIADRQTYVMKIIDVSRMDRKQREDAINEVHVLKALRHPYIITYKESFMDKRCLCIVMDYADGGDMYTKIANQKKIGKVCYTENQIVDWFVQMALAIKHIHDRKILHRDLKTQNIFMNQNGQIKIGDFGIARVLQHTYDCAQTAIGTPYYLSPEICQEQPYNQKSDIWSLGCILYEMCTLRHAFDANSMKGLVLKILRSSYPQIPSHYSEDLKAVIQEMLIKDPVKRPSMRKILDREFLAKRISKLLTQTIAKDEFSETFVQRHLEPHQIKENGEGDEEESKHESVDSSIVSQQKKMSKEAAARKKKKMEIVGQDPDEDGASNMDVSESREKVPAIKEIDQNQRHQAYFNQHGSKQGNPKQDERAYNNYLNNNREDNNHSSLSKKQPQAYRAPSVKKIKAPGVGGSPVAEDLGEEAQQAVPNFLKNLPGVTGKDSMGYRIEALRVYLENILGDQAFLTIYRTLNNLGPEDDVDDNEFEQLIGKKKMQYINLIHQLLVCEDSYYQNKNEA